MRKILVNADDFGLDDRVTQAILEAFRQKFITQTTLMVNMPYADTAVGLARQAGLEDKIGLHLNFTQGVPMTADIRNARECCDDNGVFRCKSFAMGWRPLNAHLAKAVADETRAQIERYLSFGLPLMHCDGHHHVHNRIQLARIVLPILKEYGFKSVRNRYSTFTPFRNLEGRMRNLIFSRLVRKYGFETTEGFGGWDGRTVSAFRRFDSFEFMVHPNYNADGKLVDVRDWVKMDGPELSGIRRVYEN